jgi:hypothetical protein
MPGKGKKPTVLAIKRTDKSRDCRDWTVVEALKETIRSIEDGETEAPEMVYVALRCKDAENQNLVYYRWFTAGATNMELSGLLTQHLHRLCMPAREE